MLAAAIAAAGVVAAVVARRELDVVRVRGDSMRPTLLSGDRLILARLRRPPRPGEIVVAPDPRRGDRELIKRVASVDSTGVTLLGDDAAHSTDARAFGAVDVDDVRWRVIGRYWPPRRGA